MIDVRHRPTSSTLRAVTMAATAVLIFLVLIQPSMSMIDTSLASVGAANRVDEIVSTATVAPAIPVPAAAIPPLNLVRPATPTPEDAAIGIPPSIPTEVGDVTQPAAVVDVVRSDDGIAGDPGFAVAPVVDPATAPNGLSARRPTATPRAVAAATSQPTSTPLPVDTSTPTNAPAPTNTSEPTFTPTPQPTSSPTLTRTATATPLPTASPTATKSPSPTPTKPPSPTATTKPQPTATPSVGNPGDLAAETYALTLINNSRAQYGKPKLTMYDPLRQVARAHARDMAVRNYFSHVTPEGLQVWDRVDRAGIAWSYVAENLGYTSGYATPSDGVRVNHNNMMAEVAPNDGHRKNILSTLAHRIGIGVVTSSTGKTYYVCDFID